jgi:hypothetical protein
MRRRLLPLVTLLLVAGCRYVPGLARQAPPPPPPSPDAPPALAAIDTAELRRDLFALAGDSMRGREAGTLDELRGAVWTAERAREAGLRPAGDDGTYFQWWPMRRQRVAEGARVVLDGTPLDVWQDAAVVAPIDASLSQAPVVWVGSATGEALRKLDVRGMAVVAQLVAPARPPVSWISLRAWRYARAAINERVAALADAGAAAVILVADDSTDGAFGMMLPQLRRGTYNIDSTGTERITARVPAVWVPAALQARVRAAKRLTLQLRAESFVYPSVNVVAVAPGRDSLARGEYVVFSGHTDHDGLRQPVQGDSSWNGADDNATVSVAMLAIGRAWTRAPGRRSALFVFHGAEERGLLGSRWFVWKPTVPRERLVAVLNGDMIGRNHPDTAALLGSQPPHRNSTALVSLALAANARETRFVVDSSWDRPTHPEGWYFRSDHLPYARAGIPSLFFTTLLHADYHTPRDTPERIDVAKLARMTRWMYATGWAVAETAARPGIDAGFKLER